MDEKFSLYSMLFVLVVTDLLFVAQLAQYR